MKLINLIPTNTKIKFMAIRKIAILASLALCVGSAVLFLTKGLNYGIDFRGGILLEIRTAETANLRNIRSNLGSLGLGEIELQRLVMIGTY